MFRAITVPGQGSACHFDITMDAFAISVLPSDAHAKSGLLRLTNPRFVDLAEEWHHDMLPRMGQDSDYQACGIS